MIWKLQKKSQGKIGRPVFTGGVKSVPKRRKRKKHQSNRNQKTSSSPRRNREVWEKRLNSEASPVARNKSLRFQQQSPSNSPKRAANSSNLSDSMKSRLESKSLIWRKGSSDEWDSSNYLNRSTLLQSRDYINQSTRLPATDSKQRSIGRGYSQIYKSNKRAYYASSDTKIKKNFSKNFTAQEERRRRGWARGRSRMNKTSFSAEKVMLPQLSQMSGELVRDSEARLKINTNVEKHFYSPLGRRLVSNSKEIRRWAAKKRRDFDKNMDIVTHNDAMKYDSELHITKKKFHEDLLQKINTYSKGLRFKDLDEVFNYEINSDKNVDLISTALVRYRKHMETLAEEIRVIRLNRMMDIRLSRREFYFMKIESEGHRVPFILEFHVQWHEYSSFAYRVYYSNSYETPNDKMCDNFWDNPNLIKIFDHHSTSKVFQNSKNLYFSIYSLSEAHLKVMGSFHQVNMIEYREWKERKNVNVFKTFLKRHNLKEIDVLTEVRRKKKKKLRLFPKPSQNPRLIQNYEEISKRPFLRNLLKISDIVEDVRKRKVKIMENKLKEKVYQVEKYNLMKMIRRQLNTAVKEKQMVLDFQKNMIIFIALGLILNSIMEKLQLIKTIYIMREWEVLVYRRNRMYAMRRQDDTKLGLKIYCALGLKQFRINVKKTLGIFFQKGFFTLKVKHQIEKTHELLLKLCFQFRRYHSLKDKYLMSLNRNFEENFFNIYNEVKDELRESHTEFKELRYTNIEYMKSQFIRFFLTARRCVFSINVDEYLVAKRLYPKSIYFDYLMIQNVREHINRRNRINPPKSLMSKNEKEEFKAFKRILEKGDDVRSYDLGLLDSVFGIFGIKKPRLYVNPDRYKVKKALYKMIMDRVVIDEFLLR